MATPHPIRTSRRRFARRARRALGGSLRAAWIFIRVAVVVAAIAVAVGWKYYGYVPVAVQTGSMAPTYPVHTLLFVHDVPASDVRTGDVITFDPPGRVPRTTHRVVKRELHAGRWYFQTKGDANPVADDWRLPDSPEAASDASWLRGVSYADGTAVRTEFAVPFVGWIAALGTLPHLRMFLLGLPFVVVAIQLLAWIWRRDEDEVHDQMPDADQAAAGDDPGRTGRAAAERTAA